jgi:type VI protein secretion system component VasF
VSVPDACESCRDAVIAAALELDAVRAATSTAKAWQDALTELARSVEQLRRCRSTTEHFVEDLAAKLDRVHLVLRRRNERLDG